MICVVEVTQIKALISLIQFHVYTQGDTIIMYICAHVHVHVYSTDKYVHTCT